VHSQEPENKAELLLRLGELKTPQLNSEIVTQGFIQAAEAKVRSHLPRPCLFVCISSTCSLLVFLYAEAPAPVCVMSACLSNAPCSVNPSRYSEWRSNCVSDSVRLLICCPVVMCLQESERKLLNGALSACFEAKLLSGPQIVAGCVLSLSTPVSDDSVVVVASSFAYRSSAVCVLMCVPLACVVCDSALPRSLNSRLHTRGPAHSTCPSEVYLADSILSSRFLAA
jgi:hypothetical protein